MEACDSFEVQVRMGGWTSKLNMGPYGCGLWRSIRMRWDGFRRYIRYEVGMGNWVLFSLGCQCGDQPVKEAFLVLYENATNWEALVESLLVRPQGGRGVGMFGSIVILMTRKWNWCWLFFISWSLIFLLRWRQDEVEVVEFCFKPFGVVWVVPERVIDLMLGWRN